MAYQVVILQQNRVCKIAVANLGANKTPTGLKRVGKCVGVLAELQATYNKELKVTELSGNHTVVSATKDKNIMLQQPMCLVTSTTESILVFKTSRRTLCHQLRRKVYIDG